MNPDTAVAGRLSVALIARNAAHNLADCLRNVAWANEVVVVDGGSTDGTRALAESLGARVIRSSAEYAYPYTQNQGAALARGELLALLDNDLWTGRGRDEQMATHLRNSQIDVACASGIEGARGGAETLRLKRRWKAVKNPLLRVLGAGEVSLRVMAVLIYRNCTRYCERRAQRFTGQHRKGMVGCAVFMTLKAREAPPAFADAAGHVRLQDKWSDTEHHWLSRIGVDHRNWCG